MSEIQPIETEQWDNDKAAAMAYLLMTRTEFPALLESQDQELEKLQARRLGIIEKSTQRSVDLTNGEARDEVTLPLRLRAVVTRAVLEETEVEIELIELRNKQKAQATETSNELLEEYSRFYDTNPKKFAKATGESFAEQVQQVDDMRRFIEAADEHGLVTLDQTMSRTKYYEREIEEGRQPVIDTSTINVASENLFYPINSMFGENSEEVRRLGIEYQALIDASYADLTPKGLVIAFCQLNHKWHRFIVDSKAAKEAELEELLNS